MTATVSEPDIDPWVRCSGCGEILYMQRYLRNARTCTVCGATGAMPAAERIASIVDPDTVTVRPAPQVGDDPLDFVDTTPYTDRLRVARETTGLRDAVVCATAEIDGHPVVVVSMDFRFMGGSLGRHVGEQVTQAVELATDGRMPIVIVTASGGARMQEGALALMQMAKTSQALAEADAAGVLTISVLTDPTYGGVAASFATLPDVILAEKGARTGFAGPRVVAQTTGESLPADFQTAASLLGAGLVDAVLDRPALRARVAALVRVWSTERVAGGSPAAGRRARWLVTDPAELTDRGAWASVQTARELDRPGARDYCALLLTDFVELAGDRIGADCPALMGGVGLLDGRPVMVVGTEKGHDTAQRVRHHFGMVSPAGYRKSARLMRLAQKWGIPVITLVDTPGADPGVEAERHGQAWAIADNIRLMLGLTVPVVALVTGEGGSGGALALGVADRVLVLSNSVYSVISPEGCASILWKHTGAARDAAEALRLHAPELLANGIADAVVPEPGDGAHTDPKATAERVAAALTDTLDELTGLGVDELLDHRRDRFRSF